MYACIHQQPGEKKNTEHQQCIEGHGTHQTVRLLLSPDILILSGLRDHFTRL